MKRISLIILPFVLYITGLVAYYFGKINGYQFIIFIIVGLGISIFGFSLYRNEKKLKAAFLGIFYILTLLTLFESRLIDYEKYTYFLMSYNEPFEIVEDSGVNVLAVDVFEAPYITDLGYLIHTLESSTNKEVLDAEVVTNKIRYRSKNEELLSYVRPEEKHFETMKENVFTNLPGTSSAINQFLEREDIEGDSAGLATVLSALIEKGDVNNNVPIAVTGAIDSTGNVKEIGSIKAKTLIAEQSGFSHILVPVENEEEAKKVKKDEQLNINIIAVASIENAVKEIMRINND
ncbi:S16 family serine protease [Solibacillus sp. FSL W7-1464]|uniref:S16 family serine protease n=1 Tax=Solibacillus sp. FSL W7-1464 TaxID=2921706 RepID=UPI0030F832FA